MRQELDQDLVMDGHSEVQGRCRKFALIRCLEDVGRN